MNILRLGSNLAGLFQMALAVEKKFGNHTAINNVAIFDGGTLLLIMYRRIWINCLIVTCCLLVLGR